MFKAILSTTVLPVDGLYDVTTISLTDSVKDIIKGVPNYIGHPDTKAIVESLGAIPAASKLFSGLEIGETALCFSIKQGRSTRAVDGFTSPHQSVSLEDLECRLIVRHKDYAPNTGCSNCWGNNS